MKISAKAIMEAFGLLSQVPPEKLDQIIGDAETLTKAGRAEPRYSDQTDHWREGETHAVPGKDTIKVGPSQGARGGNAETMISEYSRTAPQHGVTIDGEKLAEELGQMRGYMKGMTDQLGTLGTSVKDLVGVLSKKKDDDEEEEEEEQVEVVEVNKKSATRLIARARELISKAGKLRDAADLETDHAAEKAKLREARGLYRKAGRLLGKARSCAYAAKAKDLKAEIRTIAKKADVTVVEEEEEEEEESEKAQQAAAAAAKAAADAETARKAQEAADAAKAAAAKKASGETGGNQADKQDAETGNQDDSKAKADLTKVASQIEAALAGISALKTTVSGLMDVVGGKARIESLTPPDTLSFVKGDTGVATLSALQALVDDKIDDGTLDSNASMRAQNLLGRVDAVVKGKVPESLFRDELAVAPTVVRELFRNVKFAA